MKTLRRISAWAALAAACTGCHYDSNVDVDEYRATSLAADLDVIYNGLPEFDSPLTLDDIYQIAANRNLNILVKELEYQIQTELVTRERFGMLPDIKMHFENLIRNKNTASSSQSLVPGVPPAPLSISSQKHQWRWDYALVWNYVDFGLAFLRSRQEYNRALKVNFEYQRLQQNLFVDITREYWKAQTAKMARKKSKIILEKAKAQQAAIKKQLEAKIISEIQGLRSEGQLVSFQAQFQFYDKEYHTALAELGLLMGLPPCAEFELADVVGFGVDACIDDICELETLALYNRPELYGDDAEELIQRDEARAAVLQLYPGVDLFAGHNHDSNKFLLFNHWIQAGTRAAYNLLDWPRHLQESRAADGRVLLARNNRVLMSISVMTQVHLAYSVYEDNLESYKLAKTLEDINIRLVKAAQNEKKQGKLHDADVLKYEIELLESQIDSLKQYGELQNALEQLNNAMGLPRYFANTLEFGVAQEALAVEAEAKGEVKEESVEENAADADELRSIYLDYIIEKIEKEETELQHKKAEALQEEIDRKERELRKDEQETAPPAHEEAAPVNTESAPPAKLSDNEDAQEPQGDEESSLWVAEILQKYEVSDSADSKSEELDDIIQKYGISDAETHQSHEDNDEKTLPVEPKEGFFARSYNAIVDAIGGLYSKLKSLL